VKTLNTLVGDLEDLLSGPHQAPEGEVNNLSVRIADAVRDRLAEENSRPTTLRLSNIGRPDRQLYYELTRDHVSTIAPNTKLIFLFGAIWEEILLFLIKEAGHTVENEQETVKVGGIVGHKDCDVDGVTVDIKSASGMSFRDKFVKENIFFQEKDSFGYLAQLSAYVQGKSEHEYHNHDLPGAFIVVNKVSGEVAVVHVDSLEMIDAEERVAHVKEMLNKDTLPERCYTPVPDGKSGNERLPSLCAYCDFKEECWSDANEGKGLRHFKYARATKAFTTVKRLPNTAEEVVII
jgi:hypothetical protein